MTNRRKFLTQSAAGFFGAAVVSRVGAAHAARDLQHHTRRTGSGSTRATDDARAATDIRVPSAGDRHASDRTRPPPACAADGRRASFAGRVAGANASRPGGGARGEGARLGAIHRAHHNIGGTSC